MRGHIKLFTIQLDFGRKAHVGDTAVCSKSTQMSDRTGIGRSQITFEAAGV